MSDQEELFRVTEAKRPTSMSREESRPPAGDSYAKQQGLSDARFDGDDYEHERDHARLTGQIRRVYDFIFDGAWRTLDEISDATGDPHSSVSAQLRNLRKKRFGGHNIERKYVGGGLYSYRLEPGPRS
jgi:hypothetical protein